jgi:regulator of protease activity HflC (stomatin/prohibitin superfamily)
LMSIGRFTAGEELRRRIQTRADELQLGVEILFVGLQDVHPPVTVGAAYERVVGTKQTREANILRAQAYAVSTNALVQAEALRRRLDASAESARRVSAALANQSLFTNQVAAYRAAPEVYVQRTYLQTLARAGAHARKFVIATTNVNQVLMLNMEDRLRDDILNQMVPAPK